MIFTKSHCCDAGMAKNADGYTGMLKSESTHLFAGCREIANGEICELVARQSKRERPSSWFIRYFGG